ncbi:hypothetical protein [Coxiella-like endosymbiont of Rhipicephalus sanguineus]|uniref:hypothetical protein n=1 Tax=Coxiella-like endosymbiont of Rhipicephalus sanguineus TaxID=1955402 RepID=UPI00203E6CEF|nr:hypothetical protein [Coxiella-like endosymbiont of Rhipicephalus sanguineus]
MVVVGAAGGLFLKGLVAVANVTNLVGANHWRIPKSGFNRGIKSMPLLKHAEN